MSGPKFVHVVITLNFKIAALFLSSACSNGNSLLELSFIATNISYGLLLYFFNQVEASKTMSIVRGI